MFDLDAAAAEAGVAPRIMRFAGRDWTIPATLPVAALAAWADVAKTDSPDAGQLANAVRALLGPDADGILAAGFGLDHLNLLIADYTGGEDDLGNSSASSTS